MYQGSTTRVASWRPYVGVGCGIVWLGTVALALSLHACGGGGGGGAVVPPLLEGVVAANYPNEGADWNDHVNGIGSACAADLDDDCVHGGELRAVVVTGKTGCNDLTAEDALGAFDWICVVDANVVRMVATGFKDGKRLSDLIDFTAATWKTNSVTVYDDGEAWLATPQAAWWGNPLVVNNDGADMDVAGTIYLVTADDAAGNYEFGADRVALVVRPGVTLEPFSNTDPYVVGMQAPHDFVWLEGTIDAIGADTAVTLHDSRFATIRGVTVMHGASSGILLEDLFFSRVSAVTALHGENDGILFSLADDNTMTDLAAINNGRHGIRITGSSRNAMRSVRASGNGDTGLVLENTADNVMTGMTIAGNHGDGIGLNTATNNVLGDVLIVNNGGSGIRVVSGSDANTLSRIAAINNLLDGVDINSSNGITLDGVAAANNGVTGVRLHNTSNILVTGPLRLANELDCNVTSPGVNPGLAEGGSCGNAGDSDAVLTTNLSLAIRNAFVGKASGDAVNADHTEGVAGYPVAPAGFDWSNFENIFRAWGIDDVALFPGGDHRGRWDSGNGRIWDWSLRDEDTVLREVLIMPHGNNNLVHTWSTAITTSILRNAVELAGNGNGLCETNETCLYSPNLGSYQGHGEMVATGLFGGGDINGVTRLRYETNGYTTEPPFIPEF